MLSIPTLRRAACLLLFPVLIGLSACRQGGDASNRQGEDNAGADAENAVRAVPLPRPPMDRAAILQAVAEARSAAAAGVEDRQAQQALDGKEFEIRIRFGCAGAAADRTKPDPLGWSVDSKTGVLRIRATPDLSAKDPALAGALEGVEAVEGFWLARPWLLKAACPVKPIEAANEPASDKPSSAEEPTKVAPAAPKVGIAQFFADTDPRTARRDRRPYAAVEKRAPGAPVGTQGFDLVLSGRLRALPDGRVIRCVASGPDSPPACIVSARFDHVWIDDPATGERIADWSSS